MKEKDWQRLGDEYDTRRLLDAVDAIDDLRIEPLSRANIAHMLHLM